jgi:hypothetical protein
LRVGERFADFFSEKNEREYSICKRKAKMRDRDEVDCVGPVYPSN